MEKSKKYFGESGLTTTSASYLANLAQEQVKNIESWLNYLTFTNETKTLVSSGKKYPTRKANVKNLANISENLASNANFYFFIAFVKEAIKEKALAVRNLPSFDMWAADKLEPAPECPDHVSEEDIIAEFDASKMCKYLRLQQFAAVYGKTIHRDGPVADARNNAYRYANDPTIVENLSNDIAVTEREPAFPIEEIDEMYNTLQAQRREYDKQLNQIKYEIKAEVNRRNNEIDTQYNAEYDAWKTKRHHLMTEFAKWKRTMQEEIEGWKIVIPSELQGTFKYLQQLGKVEK